MRTTSLILRVHSYRDAPPPVPLEAHFDAAGGSIGRGAGNLLVLDDENKYLSRVHGTVALMEDRFHLTDRGRNPSLVNGRALGAGASAALAEGDLITMGDYLLEVAIQQPADEPDRRMAPADAATPVPPPPPGFDVPLAAPLFAAPVAELDALAYAGILADADPSVPARSSASQAAGRGALNDHLSPEWQALRPRDVDVARAPAAAPGGSSSMIPADYDPLAKPSSSAPPPLPAAAPVQGASAGGSDDAVMRALLDGLGLAELRTDRAPADLARLVGAMLRATVSGTMEVLVARALTKRESRIDMTMIAARANNPLKFFPDADSALARMLAADGPGYLPGLAAIDAAFDDLKGHELAVIAGMRAALAAVVERFDPARLEQRLAQPDRLERLLPARRKARMWDRLVALYAEMGRDADEDLQRLFGERFSRAYQDQVARAMSQGADAPLSVIPVERP